MKVKKQLGLKAILDSDIEHIFEQLGVLELVNAGKIKCEFCKRKIGVENLHCIYIESNKVKYCCSRISCYDKLIKKQTGCE